LIVAGFSALNTMAFRINAKAFGGDRYFAGIMRIANPSYTEAIIFGVLGAVAMMVGVITSGHAKSSVSHATSASNQINKTNEINRTNNMTETKARGALTLTYVLYGIGVFFPLLTIIGLIVAHLKAGETKGSWVGTHFRWLIRTFWFSVLWSIAIFAVAVLTFGIGSAILALIVGIWYIYRVIKGALSLSDEKAMY